MSTSFCQWRDNTIKGLLSNEALWRVRQLSLHECNAFCLTAASYDINMVLRHQILFQSRRKLAKPWLRPQPVIESGCETWEAVQRSVRHSLAAFWIGIQFCGCCRANNDRHLLCDTQVSNLSSCEPLSKILTIAWSNAVYFTFLYAQGLRITVLTIVSFEFLIDQCSLRYRKKIWNAWLWNVFFRFCLLLLL